MILDLPSPRPDPWTPTRSPPTTDGELGSRHTTTPTQTAKPVAPRSVPVLAADLDAGLRRLKLAAIRRTAPEVLITAKTQRWTPEEVLRTLVETEIAARDASNVVNRLKAAGFPVAKTLESFDVAASSIPAADVRLPVQPGMDTRPRRTWRSSDPPAPGSPTP